MKVTIHIDIAECDIWYYSVCCICVYIIYKIMNKLDSWFLSSIMLTCTVKEWLILIIIYTLVKRINIFNTRKVTYICNKNLPYCETP